MICDENDPTVLCGSGEESEYRVEAPRRLRASQETEAARRILKSCANLFIVGSFLDIGFFL